MTRDQFLDSLKQALQDMDAGERAEILADYTAYFRQAAAAGRQDSEVATALGSSLQLADALRRIARVRQPQWEAANSLAPDKVTSALGVLTAGAARFFGSIMLVLIVVAMAACASASIVGGLLLLMVDLPELGLRAKVSLDIAGYPIADTDLMMATGLAMLIGGAIWLLIDVRLLRHLGLRIARHLASTALAIRQL